MQYAIYLSDFNDDKVHHKMKYLFYGMYNHYIIRVHCTRVIKYVLVMKKLTLAHMLATITLYNIIRLCGFATRFCNMKF